MTRIIVANYDLDTGELLLRELLSTELYADHIRDASVPLVVLDELADIAPLTLELNEPAPIERYVHIDRRRQFTHPKSPRESHRSRRR